jgi:hypothetical protein
MKEQLPSDPSIEWTRNGVPPLPSAHVECQALLTGVLAWLLGGQALPPGVNRQDCRND